jgi:hypothetical protein
LKSVKEVARGKHFVSEKFSERARLFCSVCIERLEEELRCRELSSYRAGVLHIFMADLLAVCGRWLNEKVVLDGSAFGRVTESDLLRYVSILLLSHCTGFSLNNSIELLKQDGVQEPYLEVCGLFRAIYCPIRPAGGVIMIKLHGTAAGIRVPCCQNLKRHNLGPVARYSFHQITPSQL